MEKSDYIHIIVLWVGLMTIWVGTGKLLSAIITSEVFIVLIWLIIVPKLSWDFIVLYINTFVD